MSCHIFFSIPDANDNVIPFRCALPMWVQRFREMLWVCEDGLCGHWYVLGLIATNTWCKPGHCSSVTVNPLSGVKSEPTAGYLANSPFWTISIFSSPKGGLRWRKTIDCIVLGMFHCSWSASHWFPDIASETSCVMTAKISPIINQICQSWRLFSHFNLWPHNGLHSQNAVEISQSILQPGWVSSLKFH